MSSTYIRRLIFSCDLWSSYLSEHFLEYDCGVSSLLQRVMVIAHLPGRSLSGFSLKLTFSSSCLFNSPGFHRIFDKLYNFAGYLVHFASLLSRFARPYHILFCCQSTPFLDFFVSFGCPWGWVDQCIVALSFLWFSLQYSFCSSGNISQLIKELKISLICAVSIFHIVGRHIIGL